MSAAGSPAPEPAELHPVASLCQAQDGSALARELGAARIPTLGWTALEEGLTDQLRLLIGGSRLEPRQRSLLDTMDWSYRLLDPVAQAVLLRFCVFAAPFSVGAAKSVAAFATVDPGNLPEALARLADHSLLVPGTGHCHTHRE